MFTFLRSARERLNRLLASPVQEQRRLARFVIYQFRLWGFCVRRLRHNNAMAMSAALSFRTIFALVPTIVLAFIVMRSVGVFETRGILRGLLQSAGLAQIVLKNEQPEPSPGGASTPSVDKPEQSREGGDRSRAAPEKVTVAERLEKLIIKVEEKLTLGRIGPVGVLLLVWAALTLLTTIERSLNRVFEAPRSRSIGRRVLLYWSVVTFVPVALVAANEAAKRVQSVVTTVPGVSWLVASLGWLGPIAVGLLLLAAVYTLMPNTVVSFRSALAGAIIAVPLWMLAKLGFAKYVEVIVQNRSLYGALGLVPLFLIWLNLSWLIFLFGAQVAYSVTSVAREQFAEPDEAVIFGPWDLLAAAVVVGRSYQSGSGAVSLRRVSEELKLPGRSARLLLEGLCGAELVLPVRADRGETYVLARPAEKISVAEILSASGDAEKAAGAGRYADNVSISIDEAKRKAGSALEGTALADIISATPTASPRSPVKS